MTNADFTPLFDRLWTAFGWSAPAREKAERAALYFRVLGDLPAASLSHAVDGVLASEDKFPKPATIRRLADVHLSSMRGAAAPLPRSMEDGEGNPRCPRCGLVGPFQRVLNRPDGLPLVRLTMEHRCFVPVARGLPAATCPAYEES